jgi:hypothetical protein
VQVFLDRLHRDVGAPGEEVLSPGVLAGIVHVVGVVRSVPDRLAQHGRDHALRRSLHQLHRERSANAVSEEKELADAEVVHHPELVVGEGAPGIVGRDRAGGFAAHGITLVHRDDAEVVLEFLRNVDHRARPVSEVRVEPAAGRGQQRESRADLGVSDADVSSFIETELRAGRHTLRCAFLLRLSKHLRRCGCCGYCCARRQYGASVCIHDRRPPLSLYSPVHAKCLSA